MFKANDPRVMMNRFTEQAEEALQSAQHIMRSTQRSQLDVEHIFLALLQQRDSLPAQIISRLGGDVQEMIRRIDVAPSRVQSTPDTQNAHMGYITMRATRVLQGAAEEADRLNDEYISTEHLLLAIANVRGSAAARVLQDASIDSEKIYRALHEIRGKAPAEKQPEHSKRAAKTIVNPPSLPDPKG